MSKLTEIAARLLTDGEVSLVLGFENGSHGTRPLFCKNAEDTARLVLDERCTNNVAVYLTKPELVGTGKIAVIGTVNVLRTIVQLAAENQLSADKLLVLTVDDKGEVITFNDFEEIKKCLEVFPVEVNEANRALLDKLKTMTREERWSYWQSEMSKCIKCYACRAACPLCYCSRCIVDMNCPQWIKPWSAPLSNMEWQINRVMHMAGRCVACGACYKACPVGIPIHLLTLSMAEEVGSDFGVKPGEMGVTGNVLSTFRSNDKENFIG